MPQNILDEALNDAENFDIKPDTEIKQKSEVKIEEDVKTENNQNPPYDLNLDSSISTSFNDIIKEG